MTNTTNINGNPFTSGLISKFEVVGLWKGEALFALIDGAFAYRIVKEAAGWVVDTKFHAFPFEDSCLGAHSTARKAAEALRPLYRENHARVLRARRAVRL